ncbi:MAG: T9SS type A sorting domain-containing protein [Lewinellaceae bacterium]|nr:T9SS type A sorting domain-containing protein [Lewinellaceae bacterium]
MKRPFTSLLLILLFNLTSFAQAWEPQAAGILPGNYDVSDISIVSEQVIWAVAIDYSQATPPVPEGHIIKVLRSVDGGATWDVTDIEEAMGRVSWDIYALDENTACITTQNLGPAGGRGIFRTTDGGETWTEVFNNSAGGVWLHFFDNQEGICINSGTMARTTDGGATWASVPQADIPGFQAGEFGLFYSASSAVATFENALWFGTNKARVYRTRDSGQSWEVFDTELGDSPILSIAFIDNMNGLAIYELPDGTRALIRTANGGTSWENLGNTDFTEITAIPCSRTFLGATFFGNKLTASSSDLGETWTEEDTATWAFAPAFLTPEYGWMSNRDGSGTAPALFKWAGGPLTGRLYVDQSAAGDGSGKTWANAFTGLQTALAAAEEGDEIWVAEGTYLPGDNPASTFLIDKNLRLYGGFAGTECKLSERDIEQHPTILSGDLNGDDVDDDFDNFRSDNVMTVVSITSTITNATWIDGFTIRNGHADGTDDQDRKGGGIYATGAPVVNNCRFEQNFANGGGGMAVDNPFPDTVRISQSVFVSNRANGGGGGGLRLLNASGVVEETVFQDNVVMIGQGGGLRFREEDVNQQYLAVRNSSFINNTADFGGGAMAVNLFEEGNVIEIYQTTYSGNVATGINGGGGIRVLANPGADNADLNIEECRFENNTSRNFGGGVSIATQGNLTHATVVNCQFTGNEILAQGGEEILAGGGLLAISSELADQPTFTLSGCTFSQNVAPIFGGGYVFGTESNGAQSTVSDCSFTENEAGRGGGIAVIYYDPANNAGFTLQNSDFSGNEAMEYGGAVFVETEQGTERVSLELADCRFELNRSDDRGGAVNIAANGSNSDYAVHHCVFYQNEASVSGGGLSVNIEGTSANSDISIDSCNFQQNITMSSSFGCGSGAEAILRGANSNIEVTHSRFIENSGAYFAGGMAILGGPPSGTGVVLVDSCTFEGNTSRNDGGMGIGSLPESGLFDYTISNCDFLDNEADSFTGGLDLYSEAPANFLVENCTIEGNTAVEGAGGLGIATNSPGFQAVVKNSRISNNTSPVGGAGIGASPAYNNNPGMANSASIRFENCLATGNNGASTVGLFQTGIFHFLNSTIAGNNAGGLTLEDNSSVSLQNTILYNPGFTEYEALTEDVTVNSIGGNLFSDASLAAHAHTYDQQNADPLFVAMDDLRLTENSPAVDAGVYSGDLPDTDLEGNERIVNCVDIGAYESDFVVAMQCLTGGREVAVSELALSPNPATDFIRLQLPESISGSISLQLYDAQGRLVRQESITAGHSVSVEGLASGLYVVKGAVGEVVYVGRFVKE